MAVRHAFGLVVLTVIVVLITTAALSTYIVTGRVERALARQFRTREHFSTVELKPLRGTVTFRPFEWSETGTGTRVKASRLTVRANRTDLLAVLLGWKPSMSGVHLEVERAIVTVPLLGPEPIFIASAAIQPRGSVGLPRREGVFSPDPPISDVRIDAESFRVSESLLFETAHLDVSGFHLGETDGSYQVSGTFAFTGSGGTGRLALPHAWGTLEFGDGVATTKVSPHKALQLEVTVHEYGSGSPGIPTGTLHIEANHLRTIPGRRVHEILDERRPGISGTLPRDGVMLAHLLLNARNDGAVISVPQFEAAGSTLRVHARGEAALATDAQLDGFQGRIEVEELDASLRPAAIPIIYYLTGGEIPPPEGSFAIRVLTDTGQNALFSLE